MYKPRGAKLTDHEEEIMIIAMEECAEVIQAATKTMRFGKEERPSTGVLNTKQLGLEIGDARYMFERLELLGVVDTADANEGFYRKRERLEKYLVTSPDDDADETLSNRADGIIDRYVMGEAKVDRDALRKVLVEAMQWAAKNAG